jgi:hypothetical protein
MFKSPPTVTTAYLQNSKGDQWRASPAMEIRLDPRASDGFAVYRIDPNRTENPYGSYLILKTVICTAYGSNF